MDGQEQREGTPRSIAIIGMGEVGRAYATALIAAGHHVRAYDPVAAPDAEGIEILGSITALVQSSDFVLVLTPAAASLEVARQASASMRSKSVYADFTSSGPSAKRMLAECFRERPDVLLSDVAILGPVIKLGITTPLMITGSGSEAVADLMRDAGAPVDVVEGRLGDAMGHKLLRSVFMKSLAAAVTEAVNAGRAAGYEEWIRAQIAKELSGDGQSTIDRFLHGTVVHAERRAEEMVAASAYLGELGVEPTMTDAAATLHRKLQEVDEVRDSVERESKGRYLTDSDLRDS